MLISFMHNLLPKFRLSFSVTFIFQVPTFKHLISQKGACICYFPVIYIYNLSSSPSSTSSPLSLSHPNVFSIHFSLLFSVCILWVTWSPDVHGQLSEGLQVTSIPKPLEISLFSDNYVISGGIHAEVIGTSHDKKCPQIQGFLSGVM